MIQEDNEMGAIIALGEGQFIEFKESLDKTLQKEIVAFANASGGAVYVGISDLGQLEGIKMDNRIKSQIHDMAYNCDPPISVSLQQIENILKIEVPEGVNKPYSCSQGFFMRMGSNTQKMKRDEILALAIKSGKVRFDEQICSNFDWNDFDEEKFLHYLKLANISYNISREEILKNIRVLTDDGFTNAGVLYFAKEPYKYIISSRIRCIHFNDDKRVEILDKKLVDHGIIGNIEFAVAYLKERIPVKYEIKELSRREYPEFPMEAYREAIVNAIIHFDYFLGDTIAIEKLKSQIVVNNKGELLFPEEDFGKRSEARNRLLSDLLARTVYMEKAGTGIKRVEEACRANGNKVEFYFTDAFRIQIHSNVDVTKDVIKDVTKDVTKELLEIIKQNPTITIDQMSNIFNVSGRTIMRYINDLRNAGKLVREGGRKTGQWKVLGD